MGRPSKYDVSARVWRVRLRRARSCLYCGRSLLGGEIAFKIKSEVFKGVQVACWACTLDKHGDKLLELLGD